jgi:hypothetical protein
VKLSLNNLGYILKGWGKMYFFTEQEAKDAANALVAKHIKEMRKLGYDIDDNGRVVRDNLDECHEDCFKY